MKVEIYKAANAQTLFACEAMLGNVSSDGKKYDRVNLVIVLKDGQNKALKTMRYYLDIPAAKVLCSDLWQGKLHEEYSEFKKTDKAERALNFSPLKEGGYRVTIMNSNSDGSRDRLYFPLSTLQARQMAISVLDYLRVQELAGALATLMQNGVVTPIRNKDNE